MAAPRFQLSKHPCLHPKLYCLFFYLSIPRRCVNPTKLARRSKPKFIEFAKILLKAGEKANFPLTSRIAGGRILANQRAAGTYEK